MKTSDRSGGTKPAAERAPAADRGAEARTASPEIQSVLDAVARLAYGTITITMHESRIVQVDVTEKTRFTA